jgi:hypothetical protein
MICWRATTSCGEAGDMLREAGVLHGDDFLEGDNEL